MRHGGRKEEPCAYKQLETALPEIIGQCLFIFSKKAASVGRAQFSVGRRNPFSRKIGCAAG